MPILGSGLSHLHELSPVQSVVASEAASVTGDYTYARPIRPRITIKTVDGSETLYTYNAFSTSNPINVTYLDTEGAVGEAGTFTIRINDNQGLIDSSDIRHVKVYIELGKTQSSLQYFMIGFGDVFNTSRPVTNQKDYIISGFGSSIQAGQLFIHRRQASKIQNIDDLTVTGDPTFNINRLVKSALTSKQWRPLKDVSIKDLTGWSTSGISDKVSINYPIVNAPFTYFSDFLDQLCSISGAVWFIDFTTGSEVFTLTYNNDLHTGVTIKSGDLKVALTDPADTTSYIKTAFNVEDSATSDSGVATRIYTTTIIDQQSVSSSFTNKGSSTLDFQALAQQLTITSDARRLDSLAFILSKVGDPQSPKDRVNGAIILDNNTSPTGTVLDTFEIPLSSIETEPSTIFVNDIDIKESLLEGGTKKIWLVLYQRSGTTGDPTHDPANTIRWHHSGIFNSATTLAGSASAVEGDRDKTLTWVVGTKGPTYTYGVFSNIRKLQSRTNQQQADILRMREVFLNTDFLTNQRQIAPYLSINLSQMSKPRRAIQGFKVTVPNNFIFKPYQVVSFADGLSGITQDLQVKRVQYIVSSEQGDPQIGTLHADITLGGLYNTLLGDCSCS